MTRLNKKCNVNSMTRGMTRYHHQIETMMSGKYDLFLNQYTSVNNTYNLGLFLKSTILSVSARV